MSSEADLRVQLNVYATKFEQFQDALNTSNDMFSQFKRKLEEMTKTIQRYAASAVPSLSMRPLSPVG